MTPTAPAAKCSPRDYAIASGIAVAVMLSRVPFRGAMLYHWDAVNFARALDHFDVRIGQPHIPGYPLYVVLGRATRWLFGDAQTALVALAVLGSGLAAGMLYLLGSSLCDRRVGLLAASGFASSPLFWFYGEIALPHALDAFLIVTAVWLAWRIIHGEHHLMIAFGAWLALTGAVRPQSETFLAPLALYALLRAGWNRSLPAAAAVWVAGNLAWLIPLLWLSGGLAEYSAVSRAFYARFSDTTSLWSGGLWGLRRNALKLGMYTAYGWSLGAFALLLLLGRSARPQWSIRDARLHVLVLWMLPALGVYLFVHMGQQGLVFVFLPALWLLSAAVLSTLPATVAAGLAAFIIAGNAALFLFAPTYPLGGDRFKLLTVDTLRRHDDSLRTRIAAVRDQLPAAHTLLLSSSWRFAQYYLPEYPLVPYGMGARWEVDEGRPTTTAAAYTDPVRAGATADAQNQVALVLFDEELQPYNQSRDRVEWLPVAGGGHMAVVRMRAGEVLRTLPQHFQVVRLDAER